ncbi:MAG TPA: CoA transferase subunit A [Candidatus Bathyarchaeota archaeon]|nr:MAG: CoA transferase subunit A [Candidatus Bathyarchaeota archaeon]HDI06856.1 CoA transferase subunit A [Candidatus Bathyarchaeota archaeon]
MWREMVEGEVEDKRITLEEAVKLVPDGAHLFWGGFGFQRPPMAFAHELVRQGKRNLTIYTCGSEIDIDILAGARVVSKFELAFFAIEGIGLAPNIQRRIRDGSVQIEDYTNLAMALRFLGGALGVPFMPIKSMLGTDLVTRSKFKPNKVKVIECPFTGEKVALVPSVNPDFSIVHVSRVDREGNAQIDGIKGEDSEGARAGKKTIVLAEEIVDTEFIRSNPDLTVIPNIYVTYVVECPWGSYPMMVYNYYDYDMEHIRMYYQQCKTEEGWQKYCEEYITGVENHMEFLKKIGLERLLKLKARKPLGY